MGLDYRGRVFCGENMHCYKINDEERINLCILQNNENEIYEIIKKKEKSGH